jgi:hypothetical protein
MHGMIAWLRENFVDVWKAISIGFTGIFGVLGLLTEFKRKIRDRETDTTVQKITKWGWISLVGIIVSTGFGLIAQLTESIQEKHKRDAAAESALELAEQSDLTLQEIHRAVHPFAVVSTDFWFDIPCELNDYKQLCDRIKKEPESYDSSKDFVQRLLPRWRSWPQKKDSFSGWVTLRLYRDLDDKQDFLEGIFENRSYDPPIAFSGDYWIEMPVNNRGTRANAVLERTQVIVAIDRESDARGTTTGKIASSLDLKDCEGIVVASGDLDPLPLVRLVLTLRNGQEVIMRKSDKITEDDVDHKAIYEVKLDE